MRLPALLTNLIRGVLFSVALAPLAVHCATSDGDPAKQKIKDAANSALWWGDFPALEKQNAVYRQPNRFNPDGSTQIDLFRRGMATVLGHEPDNAELYFNEMDKLTLQWAVDHPQSALAHILHAKALVAHGWSYRGAGWAKDVPEEAWKEFHAYLRRAVDYLKAHADVALTDSYAHYILLHAGKGLDWTPEQMAAIADDGIKRNPDDIDLYFEVVSDLVPKWGGNARVLDDYIKKVTEQTREKYGEAMYARLYSYAADVDFGQALFEKSFADWDKMKKGYADMFARYPDGTGRLNRYAYMACIAKDKDTLLKLFKEIGTRIEANNWGSYTERSVESCRRWASES